MHGYCTHPAGRPERVSAALSVWPPPVVRYPEPLVAAWTVPSASHVVVLPSHFTPPSVLVVAAGNVYIFATVWHAPSAPRYCVPVQPLKSPVTLAAVAFTVFPLASKATGVPLVLAALVVS